MRRNPREEQTVFQNVNRQSSSPTMVTMVTMVIHVVHRDRTDEGGERVPALGSQRQS